MHLVDQKEGAGLGALGHLSDLPQQIGEVLFRVARVGHSGGRLHVELDLEAGGDGQAEGLDHTESPFDAVPDPVLAAHLAQQPGGHARERKPEVGLGANLLHVGRRPAGLAREHVELHQQHGLADAAEPLHDHALLGGATLEPAH